jgi:hypothetical protein
MSRSIYRKRLYLYLLYVSAAGLLLAGFPLKRGAFAAANSRKPRPATPLMQAETGSHFSRRRAGFVIHAENGNAECRPPTAEEAYLLKAPSSDSGLHRISHLSGVEPQSTGLKIVLNATKQLEGFPDAKAAFVNAAANWENLIETNITIQINVDYGPTMFGQIYPTGVLGSTSQTFIGSATNYPTVRSKLISTASSAEESSMYNKLPASSVPTDLGVTSAVVCPSSIFRALGMLAAVADPATETPQIGPPPSIGFNSAFSFDFDPSDGIDQNSYDFDAVATHEIGHALGFISLAGSTEQNPSETLAVSVWDLFRFHPGVTVDDFATTDRVESLGGDQNYFFGGSALALSTGEQGGSTGDGFQTSHWESVDQGGVLIGIMDPSLPPGQRRVISANDISAIDSFGYSIKPQTSAPAPVALSSGVPMTGSVSASTAGACTPGPTQYTIDVPSGTTQLTVALNGNQDDDLLVRFGQPVSVSDGQVTADFIAKVESSGTQSVTITPSSTPALQDGTYYIAVGNCSTGTLNFTITADIEGTGLPGTLPLITGLTADLEANVLTLTGTATDTLASLTKADVIFLDGDGNALGTTTPFQYAFGSSNPASFTITLSNLANYPQAVAASVTVFDNQGNISTPALAFFAAGDAGGPQINVVVFDGLHKLLKIKGEGFKKPIQLEINGTIVAPPLHVAIIGGTKKSGGTKLKITGTGPKLNLTSGFNRVQVISNGLRSNLVVVSI